MKTTVFLLALCGAAGLFVACGGSGGQQIITPPPPVVSISITAPNPLPTTVASGGTIQFGATVTGSSNTAATWSVTPATAGYITLETGLFTAAALSTPTSVKVTATATADTTKTATTPPFTVTGMATITSLAPATYYCDMECGIFPVAIQGFGFVPGGWATSNPDANFVSGQFVNSTELFLELGLDTPHTSDGPFVFTDCRTQTSGCSNPATWLELGNQNNLVVSPVTGELYLVDRAAGAIWKFKPDGTADSAYGPSSPMPGSVSIAFGSTAQSGIGGVWLASIGIRGWTTAYPNVGSGLGYANDVAFTGTNYVGDVATANSVVCSTENTMGFAACFTGKGAQNETAPYPQSNVPFFRVAAGQEPWTLAMYGDSSKTLIATYDRAIPTLYIHSATVGQDGIEITFTKLLSVPIPFTPVSDLRPNGEWAGSAGNWSVAWLTGELVVVKGSVLNTDNSVTDELVFVDAVKGTVSAAVELPASSFRLVAEPGGNAVDVESAVISSSDPAKVMLTISRVTTAGKVSTIYTATIDPATDKAGSGPLVGVGFGISPDGKHLYTCARNQCAAVTPQQ